ncbi:F-box SKIP23-like protein [Medicago truncatula]|uniref:F-box SKIP23-like protein n=1 Tax=Medicago truncatula TaxID=3880 RepID=G7KWP9_MEDTR|nr:F-box SKIP23-like protein [Medicago truncatula]
MEVDWSQLPSELLQLISQKLSNIELYLIRFRSVCSTWRSSSIPPNYHQNHLRLKFPRLFSKQLFNHDIDPNIDYVTYLIKHNLFIIKPPTTQHQHRPWLIMIGPDFQGKTQLWHPFSLRNEPLSSHFDGNVLDFNKLSVLHIGHMFYFHRSTLPQNSQNTRTDCKFGVASCQEEQPFVIVTTEKNQKPVMFRCGDDHLTTIPNMSTPCKVMNCAFKGRPCVVDSTNQTVMIGPDMSIHLMAQADPWYGGRRKFLVASSEFQLLLDEKEKKWVKLRNLGDTILFLGDLYSFSASASASDLGLTNGNGVIFTTDYFASRGLSCMDRNMSVFHLDQGRVSPLSDYPDYFKLFWPPPDWITELNS